MYTTVDNVRKAAGFVGNTNVADSFISLFVTRAQGMVNSYLSDAYVMPLPKYYRNQITFTGTGNAADTLTITIDGTAYAIAITNLMTAAQAADAFRALALESDSFVLDGLGSGSVVTFYSRGGSDSDAVTISNNDSPQSGITATGGTVTEVAAPLVEHLATEVAASYLLINEYGEEAQDTNKDGVRRLALVRAMLESIRNKEEKVFNYAEIELPGSDTKTISFFPGEGSVDREGKAVKNFFTMNKKF